MAKLYDATISKGGNSGDITVTPGTAIGVNGDAPFHVMAENGSHGLVPTCDVITAPYSAAFVATSDTIRIYATFKDLKASVYDNTEA